MGNYPFLPHNAAILDISPHTDHQKWAASIVADMPSLNWTLVDMPLQHSPLVGLALSNRLNTTKRESYDRFWQEPTLPHWQRTGLIAGNVTCEVVHATLAGRCQNDWALLHSVIHLDLEQLVQAVSTGLQSIGARFEDHSSGLEPGEVVSRPRALPPSRRLPRAMALHHLK
ncbi:hypothetical protein WJX84_006880 [Apatococcus fuscideae]